MELIQLDQSFCMTQIFMDLGKVFREPRLMILTTLSCCSRTQEFVHPFRRDYLTAVLRKKTFSCLRYFDNLTTILTGWLTIEKTLKFGSSKYEWWTNIYLLFRLLDRYILFKLLCKLLASFLTLMSSVIANRILLFLGEIYSYVQKFTGIKHLWICLLPLKLLI